MSKLIERVVADQLSTYMSSNALHCPVQSAYRPFHSTETALLKIANDILCSIDKGKGVVLVLLDLSAAFDTIDHDIMLQRLSQRLGIGNSALDWFKSYLCNREQSIFIDGKTSNPVTLHFGVPQGSVLGPIKFSVYSSPVYEIAQSHQVQVHCYADDTQIYQDFSMSAEECQIAVSKVEKCVKDIKDWMMQNKLKLNDDKTEVLIINSPRQKIRINTIPVQIGDSQIVPSKTAKNLGVIFDSHFSMDKQIKSICQKSYFHLRNIGKIKKYLNKESLLKSCMLS